MTTTEAPSTFLFADLAGFTALTEAHGDERAAELAVEFDSTVRALLPPSAECVTRIGDALMLRSSSADDAVRLGLAIVDEAAARHGRLMVRVGMNSGPAVRRDNDWFGAAVNLAARVSAAARADEVLLTQATRDMLADLDAVKLHAHGEHVFRNITQRVRLYSAHHPDNRPVGRATVDPVCRMIVDAGAGAGVLRHRAVEYRFCSLECAGRFATAPERYVKPLDRSQ